jgi:hypothetical protein
MMPSVAAAPKKAERRLVICCNSNSPNVTGRSQDDQCLWAIHGARPPRRDKIYKSIVAAARGPQFDKLLCGRSYRRGHSSLTRNTGNDGKALEFLKNMKKMVVDSGKIITSRL